MIGECGRLLWWSGPASPAPSGRLLLVWWSGACGPVGEGLEGESFCWRGSRLEPGATLGGRE